MRTWLAIIAITATGIGCSNSAPAPLTTAPAPLTTAPAKETAPSPVSVPLTDARPAVDELIYPEKADVVAILFRARELRQKSQFHKALDLVAQALEIDAHSPSALSMQRELVEIVKKIQKPEGPAPADAKSRRDAQIPA